MYKKYLLLISLSFMIMGCSPFSTSNRIPKGNRGEAQQSDTTNERIIGSIEGEIELPESPFLDAKGEVYPPQKIRIDGVDAEIPVGSKGKLKLSVSGNSSSSSFTEISSSWKLNSAPVQLFMFGGFMVAAGVILMVFGMWWLGFGISLGGGSLIACGVMINQYPWVVLVVFGIVLLGSIYYIYTEYTKKKVVGEKKDTAFVLETLVNILSDLPNDILETYVKKPLREHDHSELIRKITQKARFKN